MTREELWNLVKTELGSTQLSLSERTINVELDDELEGFGEDEEKNSKIVAKVVNRLKRMDGQLHADVSAEVKKHDDEAEKRRKKDDGEKGKQEKGSKSDDEKPQYVKDLEARIQQMENDRKTEQAERAKHATLEAVKNGLKDKFDKAGMKLNSFFEKSALARLEIPEEGADLNDLIANAERLYNADIKEAGMVIDKPRSGGSGGTAPEKEDKAMWDDIRRIRQREYPGSEKKTDV